MPSSPTVSAVIPVHNGERYIECAIRSALAQTHAVCECIVVDDGSDDATARIVATFGDAVTYVRHPTRLGVSAARNEGMLQASGEFIAYLDHDDEWLPAKLERQLAAVAESGAALALCAVQVVDAAGEEVAVKRLDPMPTLVEGMVMFTAQLVSCSSAGLIRRDALKTMGGFDERLSMSADWDLLMRMLLERSVVYVDEPLVRYRVHGSNMSGDVSLLERDMRRALQRAFAHPHMPDAVFDEKRAAYGRLYRMLTGSYRDAHKYRDAARTLACASFYDRSVLGEAWRARRHAARSAI